MSVFLTATCQLCFFFPHMDGSCVFTLMSGMCGNMSDILRSTYLRDKRCVWSGRRRSSRAKKHKFCPPPPSLPLPPLLFAQGEKRRKIHGFVSFVSKEQH